MHKLKTLSKTKGGVSRVNMGIATTEHGERTQPLSGA